MVSTQKEQFVKCCHTHLETCTHTTKNSRNYPKIKSKNEIITGPNLDNLIGSVIIEILSFRQKKVL